MNLLVLIFEFDQNTISFPFERAIRFLQLLHDSKVQTVRFSQPAGTGVAEKEKKFSKAASPPVASCFAPNSLVDDQQVEHIPRGA
jgi:hypothetical protein